MDRGLAITLCFMGIAFVVAIAIFNPSSTLQSVSTLSPITSTGGNNPQIGVDLATGYGIESVPSEGVGLKDDCNTNEVMKRTASGWDCASDQGSSGTATFTVQLGDSDIATSTSTIDFNATHFTAATSTPGEVDISLAEDGVSTTQIDDGSDTPVAGECLLIPATTTEIEYVDCITETELDTEAELEAQLTDVADVFTDNDGALSDDDVSDDNVGGLADVTVSGDGAGSLLVRNSGDTAFEDVAVSGDATLSAAGALEVAQADALEADPTDCSANQRATSIDAEADLTCEDTLIFRTASTPAGTSPVAETDSDTLALATSTGIAITGNSTTDTITVGFDDVDSPTDEECATWETGGGATGIEWQSCGAAGGSNSFETIDAPAGTDPKADSATDTLALATSTGIAITGDSATDTLTIALDDGADSPADEECATWEATGLVIEWQTCAGGSGDSIEVEDGDNAGTFTAIDTTARLDDSGDINFQHADGGAGGPDTITASVGSDAVALGNDTTGNFVAGITGGDGIAASGGGTENATVDIDTASEEAGFLNDGGSTSLTCGSAAAGKAQVMDDGSIEYCDGAATSVLQTGFLDADGTDDDTPDSDAEVPDTLTVDNASTVDADALGCDVGDDNDISEDCIVADSLDAGEIAADAIGVAELDDGSDTPVAGECVKVASGAAEFEADACEGITAGDYLTRTADDIDLDAEVVTDTKGLWFEDPTAADDFQSIWTANGFAATLTKIWCESDQTVTLMLQVDDGTAADADATDLICTTTPDEDEALDGDATLADGDRLDLAVTSVSGTPTWVALHWTFTKDD